MTFIVFVVGMILLFGIRELISPKKKRRNKRSKVTKSKNRKQHARKRPVRAAR